MKPRIEIKPARFSNAARFLALEAILLPACVSATINGGRIGFRLFGIFGLVFFGLGGLAGLCVMLSRTWSFALTQDGIEVNGNNLGYKATLIPWADVALIGVATIHRREVVGIRFGWNSLDRPPRAMVQAIENYRRGPLVR